MSGLGCIADVWLIMVLFFRSDDSIPKTLIGVFSEDTMPLLLPFLAVDTWSLIFCPFFSFFVVCGSPYLFFNFFKCAWTCIFELFIDYLWLILCCSLLGVKSIWEYSSLGSELAESDSWSLWQKRFLSSELWRDSSLFWMPLETNFLLFLLSLMSKEVLFWINSSIFWKSLP